MTPLLQLSDVTKSFQLPSGDPVNVLRGISCAIEPGERVAIVGRSGSGKSTLLNILGLMERPSTGTYRCAGTDVSGMDDTSASRLRGAFVGFIFQQFHLMDRRTALENVAEPLLFAGASERRQRRQRAATLLERVGLTHRAHSMPHLMSGGEKQRVAIARALIRSPRLILADEPTGSLDAVTGETVLDLLFAASTDEGATLIVVTHDHAVARRADRILTIADGRLEERPG